MRYRIEAARFDIPTHTVEEFDAPDDGVAQKRFDELSACASHEWDRMSLKRIEVVEKSVLVSGNKNFNEFHKIGS